MKLFRYWVLLGALMLVYSTMTQAQGRFIRRMQEEAERKAVEEIFGKDEKGREETENRRRSPEHRAEGGLIQEAPDVQKAIADASSYFSSRDFKGTRHEIRQALWGVELEMGNNVLQSLPEKVGNLQYLEDNDKVASSGIGFVGLIIERIYEDGKDMQLVATIGNDAGIIGAAAVLMAGEMYR